MGLKINRVIIARFIFNIDYLVAIKKIRYIRFMKKLSIKQVGLVAFCAILVAGCNNKDKEEVTETPPAVTPITNVSCDDASIKNALVHELTGIVEKEIVGQLKSFASDVDDLESKAKSRLPEIAVDLQNVREEAGVCKTDLHITMPMSDVGYANRYFKSINQPSVGEQAEELSIAFNDNAFVSEVSYRVEGGDIKLDASPEVLSVVASATSAGAYAMLKAGSADNKAVTRPSNASVDTGSSRPVAPAPAPTVRPRPPKPADTTHSPKPPAQKPKASDGGTNNQSNTQTAQSDNNKNAPKAESPKAEAPKATRSEPKPEPKEAVKDTTSEITIVETDDTY